MKCVACGKEKFKGFKKYRYKLNSLFERIFSDLYLYECCFCSLKQVDHSKLDKEKLTKYYQNDYREDGCHTDDIKDSQNWYLARANAIVDLLIKFIQNKKSIQNVFEIGAGYGYNLEAFRKHFKNINLYTDEINEKCIDKLKSKNILISEFEKNNYDVVVMSHVLEHFIFPVEIIQKIYNSLNDKGFLFIEVPNNTNLSFKFERAEEPHITFFDLESLEKFFKNNFNDKFEIKYIKTCGTSWKRLCQRNNFKKIFFFIVPIIKFFINLKNEHILRQGKPVLNFSNESETGDGRFLRVILQKI